MQCALEAYIYKLLWLWMWRNWKNSLKFAFPSHGFHLMPVQILLSHLHILYSKNINANVLHNYTFAHTGDEISRRKCGRELAIE